MAVGAALGGDRQSGAHALAGLLAGDGSRVDAGSGPEGELLLVGARVVASGDEAAVGGDGGKGGGEVGGGRGGGGIIAGADNDEVVGHDEAPADQVAAGDVGGLRLGGVHEDGIGVALAGHAQGRARAHRDHLDGDARLRLEAGDKLVEEAAVVGGGGRGEDDRAAVVVGAAAGDGQDQGAYGEGEEASGRRAHSAPARDMLHAA